MTEVLEQTKSIPEAAARIIHEIAIETQEGRMAFPQVVAGLLEIGVESYSVDYIRWEKTCYFGSGASCMEPLTLDSGDVAEEFSAVDLVAALRAAQADAIRYPEFVRRAMSAGVASYRAFLTGRRVVYLGRKGGIHVEEFPAAK
ncbi:MAG TPA: hypothetical protein VG714_06295 [Acidobacteriaceae bacterium]|nr:hypothetical protein [Acidobacteriaceae bacterium]